MIDAGLWVFGRLADLQRAAQHAPLAIGIAVDEEAHEIGDVLLGPGQPVLQGQEIGAHILGRARDEAQDLRQPAQHLHAGLPLLPRSRLSSAIGPLDGPSILKRPSRVILVTSPADMMQTMASQESRRACSAGISGRK